MAVPEMMGNGAPYYGAPVHGHHDVWSHDERVRDLS